MPVSEMRQVVYYCVVLSIGSVCVFISKMRVAVLVYRIVLYCIVNGICLSVSKTRVAGVVLSMGSVCVFILRMRVAVLVYRIVLYCQRGLFVSFKDESGWCCIVNGICLCVHFKDESGCAGVSYCIVLSMGSVCQFQRREWLDATPFGCSQRPRGHHQVADLRRP